MWKWLRAETGQNNFAFPQFFSSSFADWRGENRWVLVSYKVNFEGKSEWKSLGTLAGAGAERGNFLKHLLETDNTSPTKIREPSGNLDVARRLESEEGRINDRNKKLALYAPTDYVFRREGERCHWDIGTCVEYQYRWNYEHQNASNAETISKSS